MTNLETQLLEEPLVLTSLVLFFKSLANGLLDFLLGSSVLDSFDSDSRELNVQSVTSGHDVVVVDDFDEGLDLGATSDTLSTHGLGDLEGSLLDTNDQSTSELLVQGFLTFIEM